MAVALDDLGVPRDLAVPGDDLATISDMAPNDALEALFCDHLHAALAGQPPSDCAVEFMTRMMSCFQPAGGCGTINNLPFGDVAYASCWADSAGFRFTYLSSNVSFTYAMNGRGCGFIQAIAGPMSSLSEASLCASTAQYECDRTATVNASDMAGSGASFAGGTFTCTDGTQLVVGQMFDCAETKQFLKPKCDGTVDVDAGCDVP